MVPDPPVKMAPDNSSAGVEAAEALVLVIAPEVVTPVLAAIAPVLFTWN